MPVSERGTEDAQRITGESLGQLLSRLHENVAEARDCRNQMEDQFSAWQQRWAARRDQISRRLESIDAQLESLVRGNQPRPRLSVVGTPNLDADTRRVE